MEEEVAQMSDITGLSDRIDALDEKVNRIEASNQTGQTHVYRTPWIAQYYGPFDPETASHLINGVSWENGPGSGTAKPTSKQGVSQHIDKHGVLHQGGNPKQTPTAGPFPSTAGEEVDITPLYIRGPLTDDSGFPRYMVPRPTAIIAFKGRFNTGYEHSVKNVAGHWEFFSEGAMEEDWSDEAHARINLRGQEHWNPDPEEVSADHVDELKRRKPDLCRDIRLSWVPDENLSREERLKTLADNDRGPSNEVNESSTGKAKGSDHEASPKPSVDTQPNHHRESDQQEAPMNSNPKTSEEPEHSTEELIEQDGVASQRSSIDHRTGLENHATNSQDTAPATIMAEKKTETKAAKATAAKASEEPDGNSLTSTADSTVTPIGRRKPDYIYQPRFHGDEKVIGLDVNEENMIKNKRGVTRSSVTNASMPPPPLPASATPGPTTRRSTRQSNKPAPSGRKGSDEGAKTQRGGAPDPQTQTKGTETLSRKRNAATDPKPQAEGKAKQRKKDQRSRKSERKGEEEEAQNRENQSMKQRPSPPPNQLHPPPSPAEKQKMELIVSQRSETHREPASRQPQPGTLAAWNQKLAETPHPVSAERLTLGAHGAEGMTARGSGFSPDFTAVNKPVADRQPTPGPSQSSRKRPRSSEDAEKGSESKELSDDRDLDEEDTSPKRRRSNRSSESGVGDQSISLLSPTLGDETMAEMEESTRDERTRFQRAQDYPPGVWRTDSRREQAGADPRVGGYGSFRDPMTVGSDDGSDEEEDEQSSQGDGEEDE